MFTHAREEVIRMLRALVAFVVLGSASVYSQQCYVDAYGRKVCPQRTVTRTVPRVTVQPQQVTVPRVAVQPRTVTRSVTQMPSYVPPVVRYVRPVTSYGSSGTGAPVVRYRSSWTSPQTVSYGSTGGYGVTVTRCPQCGRVLP